MNKIVSPCVGIALLLFSVSLGSQSVCANTTVTEVMVPCESCFGTITLTGKIKVNATPSKQTVKIKPSGAQEIIGVNTAQYDISASEDTSYTSCGCTTVDFIFIGRDFPIPTAGPTVSLSGSGASRSAKVSSPIVGKWDITFEVAVKYHIKLNGKYWLDEDVLDADGNPTPKIVTFPGYSKPRGFKAVDSDYALTVFADENKPFSPDPPKCCDKKGDKCNPNVNNKKCVAPIRLTFNTSLVEFEDGEKVSVNKNRIKKVVYVLAVEGAQTQIIVFMGYSVHLLNSPVVVPKVTSNVTGEPPLLYATIPVSLCAREAGEKTATLTVEVTLKGKEDDDDDIVLEDSDEISFTIPKFSFGVYVRPGGANDKDNVKHEMRGKGKEKFINVGHAAWEISVCPSELQTFPTDLQQFANKPWGSGPAFPIDNNLPQPQQFPSPPYPPFWPPKLEYPVDASMISFALAHPKTPDNQQNNTPSLSARVPGWLTNKDVGSEIKRYVIEERSNVVNALKYINERPRQPDPPVVFIPVDSFRYEVPDKNCVDQFIEAMGIAGVSPEGFSDENCKGERKLYLKYPDKTEKEWTIKLSIPQKLQNQLTNAP